MSDSTETQALPCPFCNSIPEVEDLGNDDPHWGPDTHWWFVHCKRCDFAITQGEECTREVAVTAWNTRAGDKEPVCQGHCIDTSIWIWCPYCGGKIKEQT